MESLQEVLMRKDRISAREADELIDLAKDDLQDRLANGEMPSDICAEWFGLEEDYIMDLI